MQDMEIDEDELMPERILPVRVSPGRLAWPIPGIVPTEWPTWSATKRPPWHVVADRRAANKRARRSRKANR